MSIVSEVLASVRRKGSADTTMYELEELVKSADDVKMNVCQTLSTRYSRMTSTLNDTSKLQTRVSNTLQDLNSLQKNIQKEVSSNIESSVSEVGAVVAQCQETVAGLEVATTLLNIHTLLDEANQAKANCDFLTTATNLSKADDIIKLSSSNEIMNDSQLDIIKAVREELVLRKLQLIYTIGEVWNEKITWEEENWVDGSQSVTLVVKMSEKDENGIDKLHQMLPALYMLGELDKRISSLGSSLMNHIFRPIMIFGGKVKIEDRTDDMTIQVKWETKYVNEDTSDAIQVLSSLLQVFEFLEKFILTGSIDCMGSDVKFMTLFGKKISENLNHILIKECLSKAVPHSKKNLNSYDHVTSASKEFHSYLTEIGFYGPEEQSILTYAANVDVVFSNKACAHILAKARSLMIQPLYNSVSITPSQTEQELIISDEAGNNILKSTMRLGKLLSAKTFCLPKCKISSSVCELVELIYETMDEACTSSPQFAGRLFYTVRNILTIYCHIIPTAHKQALATLPEQAALVHNNCMYLSHHAMLLGDQYKSRFPQALADSSFTAIDLAQNLRITSVNIFLKSLRIHKTELIDSLKETKCLSSVDCDLATINRAEQGVRQCLHQIHLLQRVWQDVLPYSVYTKAMGTLVNSVLEELISRVVAVEDISADAANAFINIFTRIKDKVFLVEDEKLTTHVDIIKQVKRWTKFCELILVLGASLKDLLDRWAYGKGPLAHVFTADETKQLIRALFQNTDRRALVLSKIK